MTVSTTGSSAQFFPNGATTHFPFRFRFFQNSDLKVFWQDLMGNIELLKLNSDYTVQGAGAENGGAIDTTGAPLPNGTLVVARVMIATQLTSFRNQGEFFAEIHEDAFDRLIMLVQQTIDTQGRGLTIPPTDPLDINLQLPSSVTRAKKILAFDERGQPIASNLSLETLEQQPVLAREAAEAAVAAADRSKAEADKAANSAATADNKAIVSWNQANRSAEQATLAEQSAKNASDAGLQLGMSAWGFRTQPFKGFAPDDGQELDRSVYPSFAAALDSGLIPTTTEADWQTNPYRRGFFVANSSPGKFRMRDLNGVSPGSIGNVFLRGHKGGAGDIGIFTDRLGPMKYVNDSLTTATALYIGNGAGAGIKAVMGRAVGTTESDPVDAAPTGNKWITNTGPETIPKHATGCWMTRLYGLITPLGAAEASSLATAYASMASRISVLEGREFARKTYTHVFNGNIGNPPANGLLIIHNLGAPIVRTRVRCVIAQTGSHGWWVGATLDIGMQSEANTAYGFQLIDNTTNSVRLSWGSSSAIAVVLRAADGATAWLNKTDCASIALEFANY